MSSTPPTSPQCHQEATRHAERSSHLMASPEQHRTPTDPSAASISAVPPPPIAQTLSEGPVTYGQQTFHHLPPGLAAQMAAISSAPRRGRPSTLAPPAVSLISLLIYKSNI